MGEERFKIDLRTNFLVDNLTLTATRKGGQQASHGADGCIEKVGKKKCTQTPSRRNIRRAQGGQNSQKTGRQEKFFPVEKPSDP